MFGIKNHHSDSFYVVLHMLCYLFLVGWAFLFTFHLLGLFYGFYKFHRKPSVNNVKDFPGISIIKPLTCIDPNLYENLKTFFTLNYPRFEILFCLQEYDSALINLIEGLQAQYPHIESHLFIGSRPVEERQDDKISEDDESRNDIYPLVTNIPDISIRKKQIPLWKRILRCGTQKSTSGENILKNVTTEVKNPKIFNMLSAYDKAQYPFILISDSGLMMHQDTLLDMALIMADDVGLVHQMPFTCDRKGFAGTVEKVFFGTQHARMYMTINLIGINCVTGMSCLIRKECIDRAGGLKAFGHYIAEDYYIAYEVAKQGWKLRVASTPALQNSGDYSLSIWMERLIRWCKLRMRLSPLAYIEPLQECFASSILAGLVTNYLFEWNTLVVAACHILLWFIFDYLMLRITQGSPLPFSKFEFAVAWLVRELSSYYVYFKAFTGSSTIRWRGKQYRLGSGTRAEEIFISTPSTPTIVVDSSSTSTSTNSTSSVTGSHLLLSPNTSK